MYKIGIVTNREKDIGFTYTAVLAEYISAQGGQAILPDDVADKIGKGVPCGDEDSVIDSSDIVICLGGDGTFLKAARKVHRKGLPILGINLGKLGFLAEVDKDNIVKAVEQLFKGNYKVEDRMMLDTVIFRKDKEPLYDTALNDVVIGRAAMSRIIHVKAYINDIFVDMFPGDGLIVSSPTGSTAYSLSAGGPIVEPDTDLLLVTPICPHILYSRSFVTKSDSVVKIIVDEDERYDAVVTLDGQAGYEIKGGDVVEVRKSPYTVKLIRMNSRNFFNILRTKIYYRGESLKRDEVLQACKDTGID